MGSAAVNADSFRQQGVEVGQAHQVDPDSSELTATLLHEAFITERARNQF